MRPWMLPLVFTAACSADAHGPGPAWLDGARVLVDGLHATTDQCTDAICQHNENTDLVRWKGAIWLVHRTAVSQVLGPNSSLHIYKSTDEGAHFVETGHIPAINGRDIRDPHFYIVGDQLYIKTLTRLMHTSTRDSDVDTATVAFKSSDGGPKWDLVGELAPHTWSFWRIQVRNGEYFSAAYEDGDKSVVLFRSLDGVNWTRGALIYGVTADTPLETELVFLPSGTMMALVRMDGTDAEYYGNAGRLRTKVCRAQPPYEQFDCPEELMGQRLDGPLAFFWSQRLFVVARKHLIGDDMKKRMSLIELGGDLEKGPVSVKEWGIFPSAGDTAYAGGVPLDANRWLISWYSSNIPQDEPWVQGIVDASDIWLGTVDFSKLK
jgi:hypothetical protein